MVAASGSLPMSDIPSPPSALLIIEPTVLGAVMLMVAYLVASL